MMTKQDAHARAEASLLQPTSKGTGGLGFSFVQGKNVYIPPGVLLAAALKSMSP